jgi:hypothetical protein
MRYCDKVGLRQHGSQIRRRRRHANHFKRTQRSAKTLPRTVTIRAPGLHFAKHGIVVAGDGIARLDAKINA